MASRCFAGVRIRAMPCLFRALSFSCLPDARNPQHETDLAPIDIARCSVRYGDS